MIFIQELDKGKNIVLFDISVQGKLRPEDTLAIQGSYTVNIFQ